MKEGFKELLLCYVLLRKVVTTSWLVGWLGVRHLHVHHHEAHFLCIVCQDPGSGLYFTRGDLQERNWHSIASGEVPSTSRSEGIQYHGC